MRLHQPIPLHPNRQRILLQIAKLRAQIIADHAVNHERPIHFARSREHLAARQVPPFFRTDNPARL